MAFAPSGAPWVLLRQEHRGFCSVRSMMFIATSGAPWFLLRQEHGFCSVRSMMFIATLPATHRAPSERNVTLQTEL